MHRYCQYSLNILGFRRIPCPINLSYFSQPELGFLGRDPDQSEPGVQGDEAQQLRAGVPTRPDDRHADLLIRRHDIPFWPFCS